MKSDALTDLLAGLFVALGSAVGILLLFGLIGVLSALPVMYFWNGVVPDLFGLKSIDFQQALFLSCLCGCLLKSSATGNSSK